MEAWKRGWVRSRRKRHTWDTRRHNRPKVTNKRVTVKGVLLFFLFFVVRGQGYELLFFLFIIRVLTSSSRSHCEVAATLYVVMEGGGREGWRKEERKWEGQMYREWNGKHTSPVGMGERAVRDKLKESERARLRLLRDGGSSSQTSGPRALGQ